MNLTSSPALLSTAVDEQREANANESEGWTEVPDHGAD
jgi:hypothetical protein